MELGSISVIIFSTEWEKGFNRSLWENLIVDVTDRQVRLRRRKVKHKLMLCWSKSLSCVTFHWIYSRLPRVIGFPGGSGVKNSPLMQEMQMWVWSWVGKIPWRRKSQPTPVFLPRQSHGQRSLVGCSPWGRKESTWSFPNKNCL